MFGKIYDVTNNSFKQMVINITLMSTRNEELIEMFIFRFWDKLVSFVSDGGDQRPSVLISFDSV